MLSQDTSKIYMKLHLVSGDTSFLNKFKKKICNVLNRKKLPPFHATVLFTLTT